MHDSDKMVYLYLENGMVLRAALNKVINGLDNSQMVPQHLAVNDRSLDCEV